MTEIALQKYYTNRRFLSMKTEAELLAEKRCVGHLTGEVIIFNQHNMFFKITPAKLNYNNNTYLPYVYRVMHTVIFLEIPCFLVSSKIEPEERQEYSYRFKSRT